MMIINSYTHITTQRKAHYMQKRLALSFLMAGLISTGYTSSLKASELVSKRNALIATTLILAPSVWQYITKKEVLTRYDLDELKSGKNILSNLYYLYLDGFWGTPPKSESIKLKGSDGGEVVYENSPKRDGSGVIGTIHTNNKNILTVSGWIAALWAIFNTNRILGTEIDFVKLLNFFKDPADAIKFFEKKA